MPFGLPRLPRLLGLACATLITLAGCKTSPESLCEHLIKLSERQFGDLDKSAPGMRDQALQRCVVEKRELKAQNPKGFDCFAACATDQKDLPDVAECEPKCGLVKKVTSPSGAASEEPVEGIPGLWVDPYADAHEDTNQESDAKSDVSTAAKPSASVSAK